jgi:hypothetical protein
MKNDHLIPVIIKDISESLKHSWVRRIDKDYNALRLETIKTFCENSLDNYYKNKDKQTVK